MNRAETYIHSFITKIYIAPLQGYYSEALPTLARLKRRVLSKQRSKHTQIHTQTNRNNTFRQKTIEKYRQTQTHTQTSRQTFRQKTIGRRRDRLADTDKDRQANIEPLYAKETKWNFCCCRRVFG